MNTEYFKFGNTPVKFEGTEKELKKFKADNDHLKKVKKSEFDELSSEAERNVVRQQRRNEYPSIGDQLDAIMKWLATESEFGIPKELKSISAKCMSVKSKYPIEE